MYVRVFVHAHLCMCVHACRCSYPGVTVDAPPLSSPFSPSLYSTAHTVSLTAQRWWTLMVHDWTKCGHSLKMAGVPAAQTLVGGCRGWKQCSCSHVDIVSQ